jgi:class 3 adenylate cyclase/tetratricopeptide (TPR) repeat protein
MEATAEAGEIVVSGETAKLLAAEVVGSAKGPGYLIAAAPRNETFTLEPPLAQPAGNPGWCLPEKIREHLMAGPVESEHRQVAVGFIEFGGTDELLAGGDPGTVAAALHELVTRIEDNCALHDVTFWGTDIAQGGGKVIIAAGAPSSSEDDVGRLLVVARTAIGVDVPLRVRVGVNYGRVFAGNFGPPYRRTYTVYGDTVNLAARLMARAGPGEIYVSDAALQRSLTPFGAEALEPFLVKGKVAPVQAHRLGRAVARKRSGLARAGSEAAERAGSEAVEVVEHDRAPLVGRDHELELLVARLRSAADGSGSCVVMEGPRGIGKSRLIAELTKRAGGFTVFSVVCDQYQSVVPYAPLRHLGRECLGVEADASAADAGTVLTEVVERIMPNVAPWLPLIASVIDADVPPTPESRALDERFRRARLEDAFIDLLVALLPGPTLIVIDDAHQIDDASAELVGRLTGRLGSIPWFVFASRCPQPGGVVLTDVPGVVHLELGPLSEDAVARLLHTVTETRPLSPRLRSAVATRSGGNPLFLLELLANDLGPGSEASLPDSIEGVLAAQIDRLPPSERRLLRVASVLGVHVMVPVLADMAGDPAELVQLRGLSEFLVEEPPNALRFRHGMLRDAAYEGLSYSRRRELHAKAGEALQRRAGQGSAEIAGLLAVHFGHAGDHRAAWRYARIAAERAWGLYANVEAVAFFEQALEAGRALGDVAAIDLLAVAEALGDARSRLGEFNSGEGAYRLARKWAAAPTERARLHYKVALVAERAGHYPRTLRTLSLADRALGDSNGAAPARLRAELRTHYGRVRYRQGRKDAVRLLSEAVELARSAAAPDVMATALMFLDEAEATLGMAGDGEHARQALEIVRELGNQPWLEARALNQLGIRAYFAGRWPEAVTYYTDSRAACERAGDQWTAASESLNIGEVLSDQGRLVEAEPLLEEALRTYRAAGTPSFIALGTMLLGRLSARKGELGRARSLLEAARRIYAAHGEALGALQADAILAETCLLGGELSAAADQAKDALRESARLPAGELWAPLLLRVLGLAEASQDRAPTSGREHLERSVAVARARGSRHEIALSLQAIADLWPGTVAPELAAERASLFEQLGIVDAARRLCPVTPSAS